MEPAKPMKTFLTKHQQAVAMTLRNLERKGLIESRLDQKGELRWYIAEKGRRVRCAQASRSLQGLRLTIAPAIHPSGTRKR